MQAHISGVELLPGGFLEHPTNSKAISAVFGHSRPLTNGGSYDLYWSGGFMDFPLWFLFQFPYFLKRSDGFSCFLTVQFLLWNAWSCFMFLYEVVFSLQVDDSIFCVGSALSFWCLWKNYNTLVISHFFLILVLEFFIFKCLIYLWFIVMRDVWA